MLQGIIADVLVRFAHHSFGIGVAASLMETLAPGTIAETVTDRPVAEVVTDPTGGLAPVVARAWLIDHPTMAPELNIGSPPTVPIAHKVFDPAKHGVGQAGVMVAVAP